MMTRIFGFGLAGLLLAGMGWLILSQARQIGGLKSTISDLSAEIRLRDMQQEISQKNSDILARERADHGAEKQNLINQINGERARYEREAVAGPYAVGNSEYLWLARWMRRICADGGGQACDLSSSDSGSAATNSVIVVTPEVASAWRDLCEDGQEDFCRWAVTGFTVQGWANLKIYLAGLEGYIADLRAGLDYYRQTLDQMEKTQ